MSDDMTEIEREYAAAVERYWNSVIASHPSGVLEKVWADAHSFSATERGTADLVNHPPHYTEHPSGVECVTIAEHMGFNLGNAIKYIWRADLKGDSIENLEKAVWYVQREIARRKKAKDANHV